MKKTAKPWWKWIPRQELDIIRKDLKGVKDNLEVNKPVTIEENDPSLTFSIPHINVINPTPPGSLRNAEVKKPRKPIQGSQDEQPKEDSAAEIISEPVDPQNDEPSILDLVARSVKQVDTGVCEYPEYEPLRRLSQDLREAKKREEEEALKAFDNIDGGAPIIQDEVTPKVVENTSSTRKKPVAGLTVLADNASRKFSQLAPAPTDSPNAKKVGFFSIIPTEKKRSLPASDVSDQDVKSLEKQYEKPVASLAVLSNEASRKFSQLAPAPTDSPHAKKIGTFSIIPTERRPSKSN